MKQNLKPHDIGKCPKCMKGIILYYPSGIGFYAFIRCSDCNAEYYDETKVIDDIYELAKLNNTL